MSTATKSCDRWVVTGANGFIGKNLCNFLCHRGITVDRWSRESIDLTNGQEVRERLRQFAPTVIVHLAAANPYAKDEMISATKNDFLMLLNLLEHLSGECKFIYAGSVAEYGCSGDLTEDQACYPTTEYGFRKLACSRLVQDFAASGSSTAIVTRFFGVFGKFEKPFRLFPSLVRKLSTKQEVELSDGAQIRDFVYVEDLCEAVFRLANLKKFESSLVNIGTGEGISVKAVCENVADSLGADRSLLKFGTLERRSFDEDYQVADTKRLEELIGFRPLQRLGKIELELSTIYK